MQYGLPYYPIVLLQVLNLAAELPQNGAGDAETCIRDVGMWL